MMRAIALHERIGTHTKPIVVTCDDGRRYIAKAQLRGRPTYSLFREQFIGILANAIGAPVPRVTVIDIQAGLLSTSTDCSDILPRMAHGSEWIENARSGRSDPVWLSGRDGVQFTGMECSTDAAAVVQRRENRARFAHLAILFAWVGFNDALYREFIYDATEPQLAYSVDHENHGLPWAMDMPRLPGVDWHHDGRLPSTFDPLRLTGADLRAASVGLHAVTAPHVIDAVATDDKVPLECEIGPVDRFMATCGAGVEFGEPSHEAALV